VFRAKRTKIAKHKTIFNKIFTPTMVKSPLFSNSKVSKLKVEKVESPPQNPVSNKGLTIEVEEKIPFSPIKNTASPNTRQLNTFATSVDHGKLKNCIRVKKTENA